MEVVTGMKNGRQVSFGMEQDTTIIQEKIKNEKEIRDALKWLDKRFVLVGNGTVQIKNILFMNEIQKIDQIIVGPIGVILLEDRAYSGKIIIDKYGNWRRKIKNDGWIGETNPLQETRKHEKLIKSIVPDEIPIKSVLCLSDNRVIIKGIENTPLDIVKCDLLVEKIENMTVDNNFRELNDQQITETAELIKKYLV